MSPMGPPVFARVPVDPRDCVPAEEPDVVLVTPMSFVLVCVVVTLSEVVGVVVVVWLALEVVVAVVVGVVVVVVILGEGLGD
jgi:hypothetical protein